MKIIARRDRSARTIDPHDDRFDGGVFGGLFDLLVGEAELPIDDRPVDPNDGDLV